jgi:hypothetical protein
LAEEPSIIRASASLDGDVDAVIEAELRFPSNVTGSVRASMIAQKFAAELIIEGARGSLTVTNPLAPQMGHSIRYSLKVANEGETVAGPSTFAAQLAAVCASVRDGLPFPLVKEDYVRSMCAIDGVRNSSRSV